MLHFRFQNAVINPRRETEQAARCSHLLCVNGGHFCDAGNLNHSFRVFPQVQEARGRIQQVADHLIVNLKDTKIGFQFGLSAASMFSVIWAVPMAACWRLGRPDLFSLSSQAKEETCGIFSGLTSGAAKASLKVSPEKSSKESRCPGPPELQAADGSYVSCHHRLAAFNAPERRPFVSLFWVKFKARGTKSVSHSRLLHF